MCGKTETNMSTELLSPAAQAAYRQLAGTVAVAVASAEAHAKASHERFNIFSTLLKEHDEVRLHTRFIHCLLDPSGSHDCGSLFLDLFFETLAKLGAADKDGKDVGFTRLSKTSGWIVHKEASRSPHGQIDLLLECSGFYGIAIENKIHAGEQTAQLSSYGDYLRSRYGDSFHLIYLTLDGKKGYTAGDHGYLRISYKEHILSWLDSCLRETYHIIPVNQALIQYRAVVRRLTNQNLESEFMKPVLEMIRQNPDIVRYGEILTRSIDAIRSEVLDDIASRLIARAKASDCEALLKPSLQGGRFGTDPAAALWITPFSTSALRMIPYKIWFEVNYGRILLGMKVPEGIDRADTKLKPLFAEMNRVMSQDSGRSESYEPSPNGAWPTGWDKPIDPLNDDLIANWMNPAQMDAEVDRVWRAIENHIRLLERAYLASVEKDPSLSLGA
jgi:hypothetical protein